MRVEVPFLFSVLSFQQLPSLATCERGEIEMRTNRNANLPYDR